MSLTVQTGSPAPSLAHSDTADSTSLEVPNISVQLSYSVNLPAASGKNGKPKMTKTKTKIETKNKELSFSFEATNQNYLNFLTALLKKHGQDDYTPVTEKRRFGLKIIVPPKKAKKDAVDVDSFADYQEVVLQILKGAPSRLTVYVNLEDVKAARKRQPKDDNTDDDTAYGSDDDNSDKTGLDHELARLRGLLEKKYANPADCGYTYIQTTGEPLPLTPAMMNQWSRAIYSGDATIHSPPNSIAFDPKARQRSLFEKGPRSGIKDDEGSLAHVSSILHDVRWLIGNTADTMTSTTTNKTNVLAVTRRAATAPPSSPIKNTPTKLNRYLRYAEDHLGVKNATVHEFSLASHGYGPDILEDVANDALITCGLTAGDAIRLKRGASDWWNGPDAKRQKTMDSTVADEHAIFASELEPHQESYNRADYSIRFEKRFQDGGSQSFFGSGITPGRVRKSADFSWYYFNKVTRRTERVPEGNIPILDPVEYPADNSDDLVDTTPEASQASQIANTDGHGDSNNN